MGACCCKDTKNSDPNDLRKSAAQESDQTKSPSGRKRKAGKDSKDPNVFHLPRGQKIEV